MVHLSEFPHVHVVEASPHLDSSARSAVVLLHQSISRFSGSQCCSRGFHARGRLLLEEAVKLAKLLPSVLARSCAKSLRIAVVVLAPPIHLEGALIVS